MDYIPVYHWLQELFPQVDSRMLEVTAKHSKDADSAVEYILKEVLPIITEKTKASSRNLSSFGSSDVEVAQEDQSSLSRRRNGGNILSKLVIKEIVSGSIHDGIDEHHHPSEILDVEVVKDSVSQNALEVRDTNKNQNMEMKELSTLYPCCDYGQSKLRGNAEAEKFTFLGVERTVETVGSCSNTSCITRTVTVANSLSGSPFSGTVDSDATDRWKSNDEGPHSNGPSADADNITIHFVPPPPHELQSNNQELETVSFTSNVAPLEDIEAPLDRTSNIGVEDIEAAVVTSTFSYNGYGDAREEDGSPLGMTAARSEQICSIDLLEQIIDDAKNNKKTLFSAVELVINMMKEVEDRESAMEIMKEESEMGGLDMLTKVMELKQMLVHAKEANDMHAGEVYGEKAVLATEVRELQSRLRSLSDERDKALAVLDEMSKIIESRIAEADEARLAAEKEKLKKEESARAALAEQEAVMEKVVQESKILQEAAEENSKLRDFLMDRGHVVDILQGEISVICQDVWLLKEKFDARVPLSQSISSSQTSCLLASSGSSRRSLSNSLNLNDGEAVEIPEKCIEPMSFVGVLPKDDFEEAKGRADRELDDMGWEFFDKDAELNGLIGNDINRSRRTAIADLFPQHCTACAE